jgi:flagellar biosynthesis chaperone FliJ
MRRNSLKAYLDYKERLAQSITQREEMLDPRRSKVQSKIEVTMDRNVQETMSTLDFWNGRPRRP